MVLFLAMLALKCCISITSLGVEAFLKTASEEGELKVRKTDTLYLRCGYKKGKNGILPQS